MATRRKPLTVLAATQKALEAIDGPESDVGVASVLLRLAAAIDEIDEDGLNPAGKLDNVSIPTYLKYAEALGMTPAARERSKGKGVQAPPAPAVPDEVGKRRESRSWRTA